MPEPENPPELDADLIALTEATAAQANRFLGTLGQVAAGGAPQQAIPLILLALSDLLAAGARLGAIVDVVPSQRFEPDDGPDIDCEPLRTSLANVFDGVDDYTEVADPLVSAELAAGAVSNDLASIAQSLLVGLQHHGAGHTSEALWWWQFSYLSSWGERAASTLRVLLTLIAHLRLDVDSDVVAEAEFDALNRHED